MSHDAISMLRDARLLVEDFMASPWRSMAIRCGPMCLSVSRMPVAERADPVSTLEDAPGFSGGRTMVLTAPHVATLREVVPAGSLVRAGEPYATLGVLDEAIPLRAGQDVCVVSVHRQADDLLEFGASVMTVATVSAEPAGA